jgi:hypothetical protein
MLAEQYIGYILVVVAGLMYVQARSGSLLPSWFPQRAAWALLLVVPFAAMDGDWVQDAWVALTAVLLLGGFSLGHGSYMNPLLRIPGWSQYKTDNESLRVIVKPLAALWGQVDGMVGYNLTGGVVRGAAHSAGALALWPIVGANCLAIALVGLLWPLWCVLDNLNYKRALGINTEKWTAAPRFDINIQEILTATSFSLASAWVIYNA